MIGWVYGTLPGPRWFRLLLLLLVAGAVVVWLFGWGFPIAAPHLPGFDADVGGELTVTPAGVAPS